MSIFIPAICKIQIYLLACNRTQEVRMDIIRAKEILTALAEGIDPTTGEVLPEDSICNKGEVVRALYTVLNRLDSIRPKKNLPKNTGKPWTQEDDDELRACFKSGMSQKDICAKFERTSGSISSRLARLGLIADPRMY